MKTKKKRGSPKGSIDIKNRLEKALRSEFPHDTVDISDGYKDNVHVLVVSRRFDSMSEWERQEWLRHIVEESGVTKKQLGAISVLLALSPGEIK